MGRSAEVVKDPAGDEAFEAADHLGLSPPLGCPPPDVVEGGLMSPHAHDDEAVEGGIGLPVTAAVEPMSDRLASGGGDRTSAT
jgi:hypothetical protein